MKLERCSLCELRRKIASRAGGFRWCAGCTEKLERARGMVQTDEERRPRREGAVVVKGRRSGR
jgi:hypothetical protein